MCSALFSFNRVFTSSTFEAFLINEAAIKEKSFSIHHLISFLSFEVTQGILSVTQGRLICLLEPISAEFRASTST